MPGMTANITIITDRRENVVRVPRRALAFSPHHAASSAANVDQSWRGSRVWVAGAGKLRPVRIIGGLDDGNYVEVVTGDIHPGDLVAIDSIRPRAALSNHSSSFPMHLPHM